MLEKTIAVGKYRISRYQICVAAIFALGFFVRLYDLAGMLNGINQDEASVAYDAFGIANYGMDRNLTHNPAHLIAWGSGQNAGYAWLLVPFVRFFGFSLFSTRLPMALVGCVSIWAFYTIMRRADDKRLTLLALFLFSICPWHVLKSRWALESNLFPDVLLWGAAALCAGLVTGRRRWFYSACLLWGLSAWCYATSFIMLPLLIAPITVILLKKKILPPIHILGCACVFLLASGPIIAFSIVNFFELPEIRTPFLTIPRLVYMRKGEFAFLADDAFGQIKANSKELLSILFKQDDGLPWNATQGSGLIYLFSLPFVIVGILRTAPPKDRGGSLRGLIPGGWIFTTWGIAALAMSMVIIPNINRINGLWFPLIWFWILGVWEIARLGKFWLRFFPGLYAAYFIMFCNTTVTAQYDTLNNNFDAGFIEAVQYVDGMDKPAYVSDAYAAYIKVLFATAPSPREYRDSVVSEDVGAFGSVYQWGKWAVSYPPDVLPSEDYAIVVRDGRHQEYIDAGWPLVRFDRFWAGQYAAAP